MKLAKNINIKKLEEQWNSFTPTQYITTEQTDNSQFFPFVAEVGKDCSGGHLTFVSGDDFNPAHVTISWKGSKLINYWFAVEEDGTIISNKPPKTTPTAKPLTNMPNEILGPIKGLLETVYAGTPY